MPKKARVVRPPRMTFAQKVNKVIARNVENKFTLTYQQNLNICELNTTNTSGVYLTAYKWLTFKPGAPTLSPYGAGGYWGNALFDISQGTRQSERVGNQIKIKRWIIKGCIEPKTQLIQGVGNLASPNNWAQNGLMGYVDIYFGKYNLNQQAVSSDLTNFYQNGQQDFSPSGAPTDKLARVNRDLYKIYYHRRFKMAYGSQFIYQPAQGAGSTTYYQQFNGQGNPSPNGYSPSATFGFDVCKYILKNKVVKYDEAHPAPNDINIATLTVWATWTPIIGQLSFSNTFPSGNTQQDFLPWEINFSTYAEYEDA